MDKIFIHREEECSYVKNAINKAAELLSASVLCDSESKYASEVVIGDTSREITARAAAALIEKIEDRNQYFPVLCYSRISKYIQARKNVVLERGTVREKWLAS